MQTWSPDQWGKFSHQKLRRCSASCILSRRQGAQSVWATVVVCSCVYYLRGHFPVPQTTVLSACSNARLCPSWLEYWSLDITKLLLTAERGSRVCFLAVIFKWETLGLICRACVTATISSLWVSGDLVTLTYQLSRNLANFEAPVFVVVWTPC